MYLYDNYRTAYNDMGKEIVPFFISAVLKYLVEDEKEDEISDLAASEPIKALPPVGDEVEVFWP